MDVTDLGRPSHFVLSLRLLFAVVVVLHYGIPHILEAGS